MSDRKAVDQKQQEGDGKEDQDPKTEPETRAIVAKVSEGVLHCKAAISQQEDKGDGEEDDQPENKPEEGSMIM